MSHIEDLMRKELEELDVKIKENQKEYRTLRKEHDDKRKAMQTWLKPTVKPRVRSPSKDLREPLISTKPISEENTNAV